MDIFPTMELRIDYQQVDPDSVKPLFDMGKAVARGTLERALRDLVEVRVSQINGCSYCVDTHIKKALKAGERQQRLDVLPFSAELPFYTEREKAALRWAESVTKAPTTHVPDEDFLAVKEHFNEKELVDLTMLIVMMNGWNRVAIAYRHLPEERS